ncbi:hypothetical protein B566_EDAN004993 [Ephemera danica]|nr:hypothetical protein B566_EDAN004993 [Ephemera danica]
MSENMQGKVFRPKKQINRKTKKTIVFDANARKEFLTGFKKRKRQRQKKAHEELLIQLKEEKKRIRDEARNLREKFPISHRPIPELEEMLTTSEQTLDFPEHSVSIKELVAPEIAPKEESEDEIRKLAAKQYRKSKIVIAKTRMERLKNKKRSKRRKKATPSDKRSKHRGKQQTSRS